jgi:hypothetical protein
MRTYHTEADLSGAVDLAPGYHGTCWVDLSGESMHADRAIPRPLVVFLTEVSCIVRAAAVPERIGVAYQRVLAGARPENYMRWHRDNEDGGVRFHAAVATDGARVPLAWPSDPTWVGRKVTDTPWEQAHQPANGDIAMFTTEPHGVVPQPERPGEVTVIFFATLYRSRADADLYTTNNAATPEHAALPALAQTRLPA